MTGHLITMPLSAQRGVPADFAHEAQHGPATYQGAEPTIDPNKATYTVMEVAYLLDLSRGVTYQYVRDGTIPAFRVGRRWVVSRRQFHAWLDNDGARVGA